MERSEKAMFFHTYSKDVTTNRKVSRARFAFIYFGVFIFLGVDFVVKNNLSAMEFGVFIRAPLALLFLLHLLRDIRFSWHDIFFFASVITFLLFWLIALAGGGLISYAEIKIFICFVGAYIGSKARFKPATKTFATALAFFLVLNSIFAISGFVFDISLFETDPGKDKVAYNGLLTNAGNESYIVMLVAYGLLRFQVTENKAHGFFFRIGDPIVLVSFLLSGSKILSAAALYFLARKLLRSGIFGWICLSVAVGWMLSSIDAIIKTVFSYFIYVYESKGLVYSLFSGRNVRFEELFAVESAQALVIGSDVWKNFEMDAVTLVFNFGVFLGGGLAVFYILICGRLIRSEFAAVGVLLLIQFLLAGHVIDSVLYLLPLIITLSLIGRDAKKAFG